MQSRPRRSNLVTNESSTDILSVGQAGVSPAEELVTRTKRDVRLFYSTGKMPIGHTGRIPVLQRHSRVFVNSIILSHG
jgi:acid phosphatase family membrane protein YuiD